MEFRDIDSAENLVESIKEWEERNYKVSEGVLSEKISIFQDIIKQYKLLKTLIQDSKIPSDQAIEINILLFLSCCYQFTIACLALLRGHFTDALQVTRRAIESCAIAHRIKKQPHLAKVWLDAYKSEQDYKQYKSEFKPSSLFPSTHPILKKLYNKYDVYSKKTHSSIVSMIDRIKKRKKGPGISQIIFYYYECDPNNHNKINEPFFDIIDSHIEILKVFEEVFKEAIDHDRIKWEIRLNSLEGRIAAHKNI